jgi:hypothetical protein
VSTGKEAAFGMSNSKFTQKDKTPLTNVQDKCVAIQQQT